MNAIQVIDRRASEAFAVADTALSRARHCRIWMEFHEDGPHTYVTSAAVVQPPAARRCGCAASSPPPAMSGF